MSAAIKYAPRYTIVVCGAVPSRHLEQAPALIAEILSPSTRQNDLTYKRELCASRKVGTYLIVDPDTKTVEQLSLGKDGGYETVAVSSRLTFTLCGACEIEIGVESLFSD
ncbi:Uma2 family endonuclease [Stieleria varia]|uniref:Putative restriction endonuclease domain-containing protein n=1 Tax=Stieleria varia TaxID=2528005 RepID=A0A5C6ALE9_9BACT|nr:Uma2 family endonuclease [Stieleria varia]TWU00855.1 hypothetical protein Pla52n_42240 [Stieleria varia]